MPDNDNEAAIDRNSLNRLGQGTDIGDIITLNDKEYTLSGIMNSYTNVWNDGKKLPGIIVTEMRQTILRRMKHTYMHIHYKVS